MALKDVLVYVDQAESALISLRLAAELAIRHGSRLTALYVREPNDAQLHWHRSAEAGLVSAKDLHELERSIERSMQAAAERLDSSLEALTRGHDIEARLQIVDGVAAELVPQYARYADLCVVGRELPEEPAAVNYTFSEQLLFVTGRPVLFVPPISGLSALGRHIVVAWNSSRPATRSLNDALPLIERADKTTVLMVNPAGFTDANHAPSPGERIVEHLRHHGAVVEAVRMEEVSSGSIADALQTKAHTLGADLIVAGAFGHPRLWEKLLGGVTRDLLARMTLPILMSH
jgi:nucleotide-binding universal stress UspA family protein